MNTSRVSCNPKITRGALYFTSTRGRSKTFSITYQPIRRFATVEPVFGNLRGNKRLHRFTLRGKTKVDGQWKLYCMMHHSEGISEKTACEK